MRDLTTDTLERIRLLQAEMQQIQLERDVLADRERAVERRLEAMSVLLDWERAREGTDSEESPALVPNAESRWTSVPIGQAVIKLLDENPEWNDLPGDLKVRKLYERLVQEGFTFGSKNPKGSINMALIRLKLPQPETGTRGKDKTRKSEDDGQLPLGV